MQQSVHFLRSISFWKFSHPPFSNSNISFMIKELRQLWKPFDIYGRIYIANEGINAQVSVPAKYLIPFYRIIRSHKYLNDISLNIDQQIYYTNINGLFPRLSIKQRSQIITDSYDSNKESIFSSKDLLNCGKEIDPKDWHNKIINNNNILLLDCRNNYEQNIGKFKHSESIPVSKYSESFKYLDNLCKNHTITNDNNKEILLYCTGGIRCVKIGSYLKNNCGINNVGMLKGGITAYSKYINKTKQSSEFIGSNFVFDNRISVPIENTEPIGICIHCNTSTYIQNNCSNPCCNKLIIICDTCNIQHQGTCSKECNIYHKLEPKKQEYVRKECGNIVLKTKNFNSRTDRYPIYKNVLNIIQNQKRLYSTKIINDNNDNNNKNHAMDNINMIPELYEYSSLLSSPLCNILDKIENNTKEQYPNVAHNICGKYIGQYLSFIIQSNNYHNILELGCFTGYSSLCMINGFNNPLKGNFITCDINNEYINTIKNNINLYNEYCIKNNIKYPLNINIYNQKASDLLNNIIKDNNIKPFDFIFIDANKKQYKEYYDIIINNNLLSKNGTIIFDNILFKSTVLSTTKEIKKNYLSIGKYLNEFTKYVYHDKKTIQYILPIRDGLLIISKNNKENTKSEM